MRHSILYIFIWILITFDWENNFIFNALTNIIIIQCDCVCPINCKRHQTRSILAVKGLPARSRKSKEEERKIMEIFILIRFYCEINLAQENIYFVIKTKQAKISKVDS